MLFGAIGISVHLVGKTYTSKPVLCKILMQHFAQQAVWCGPYLFTCHMVEQLLDLGRGIVVHDLFGKREDMHMSVGLQFCSDQCV